MLTRCAGGFGAVALAALAQDKAFAAAGAASPDSQVGAAGHGLHHAARAKQIIFLYMDGGPSQVDTFDPKPLLSK
ncbi:MAG: DUF1501 domain-containing protein, partial [Planctomycetaceae bacterium]